MLQFELFSEWAHFCPKSSKKVHGVGVWWPNGRTCGKKNIVSNVINHILNLSLYCFVLDKSKKNDQNIFVGL
jgi:hypothetical protein